MNLKLPRRFFLSLLSLILFVNPAPTGYAEKPEDELPRGAVSSYTVTPATKPDTDGSDWDNEPVDETPLRIGLDYGDSAPYEIALSNPEGLGFRLGCYDEGMAFCSQIEFEDSALIIRPERKWHVLLDGIYDTAEEAAQAARHSWETVIRMDGKYRVITGSYRSAGEVYYLIAHQNYHGRAWQDDALGIFNGAGKLLWLLNDEKEFALEAVSGGKAVTAYNEQLYYGSFLLRRGEDDRLTVVNVVELEDYVKGVVPYEMSASWPIEALRAQAVCARTYAVFNRGAFEEDGFDLTDDTESQVYRGLIEADETTDLAVDSTAGLYVRFHGQICEIYYFAFDGGATEDGAHIFGSDQPYLAGKTDPYEQAIDFTKEEWTSVKTSSEITARLINSGLEIGQVTEIETIVSELGNVIGMKYFDDRGACLELYGRDSYKPLMLNSARFSVEKTGEEFVFTGVGWGHNCGMSQWGANAMAAVYGLTCDDIISFYFTGACVA